MDEELDLENTERIEGKKERKIQREAKKEEIKSTNKGISQVYYKRTITTSRQDRYKLKNIQNEYYYYVIKSKTLPQTYKNKLKKMTNNNAYLWKRIYFYGSLPIPDNDNSRTIYKLFCDKTIIYHKNNEGERSETIKYKKDKDKDKGENKDKKINYKKNHNFKFKNV